MARNSKQDGQEVDITETLSYPAKTEKLEDLLKTWKEHKRVRCCHKERDGYEGTCYYPLNVVLDKDHNQKLIQTEDGPAVEATCSWDRRHVRADGSPQFILVEDLKAAEEK